MKYSVIALDLDGTLTNHEKEVTPRTRQVLMQAMDEGATVVLASGDPPTALNLWPTVWSSKNGEDTFFRTTAEK